MNSKSKLGQFYTTNSDYILQGMKVPDGVNVIEPFCGQGDLVKWVGREVERYDIDPKIDAIIGSPRGIEATAVGDKNFKA